MPKQILLVENEGFMGEYVGQLLGSVGHEVRRAWNEFEAYAAVAGGAATPDLIICDMSMQRAASGLDLLRSLTALPEGAPRPPVAILSARQNFEYLEAAARLGASAYLIKPVEPARLLREVEACFNAARPDEHENYLRILQLDEKGFRVAMPFGALSRARAQLYNLILEEFRTVPPRMQLLQAEHDPMDASSYLVRGIFAGPPHEIGDLLIAWGKGRAHVHGL